MGFKRGISTHTGGIRGIHSFRNDPDVSHQTCTKCGCHKVVTHSNKIGRNIISYFDRNGNKLDAIPSECKGLWDLLNEEE